MGSLVSFQFRSTAYVLGYKDEKVVCTYIRVYNGMMEMSSCLHICELYSNPLACHCQDEKSKDLTAIADALKQAVKKAKESPQEHVLPAYVSLLH